MPARDPCIDYFVELLSPNGAVTARRMFGGWGVYLDGVIIGLVADETLYFKADEQTRARFETAGSTPFVFDSKSKRVTTSYWSAPDGAMDSPEAMRPWAQLALQAALRKAALKPAGKRNRL